MQSIFVKGMVLATSAVVLAATFPALPAHAADTVLTIDKQVRNVTRATSFADSATAQIGDVLEYQATIRNTGSLPALNVSMSDITDNNSALSGRTNWFISRGYTGSLTDTNPNLSFGSLEIGGVITIRYQVTVQSNGSYNVVVCNTATAAATSVVSVNDRVCVSVLPTTTTTTQLSVTKEVRNVTKAGIFTTSAVVMPGETAEYQIRVRNASSVTVNNVLVTDPANNAWNARTNMSVSRAYSGQLETNGILLNNLEINGEAVIKYQVTVPATGVATNTYCNTVTVKSDTTFPVSGTACVSVQGTTVTTTAATLPTQLVRSVSVMNETKNTTGTAVDANREDYLTYTFMVANPTTTPLLSAQIQVDLSGILPLVDVIDNGGGTLSGNTLTYATTDVNAGSSISKKLRVRVKYFLPPYAYSLTTSYGNDVRVNIPAAGAPTNFVAPKTGGNTTPLVAVGFAALCAFALALVKNQAFRKVLFS